MIALLLLVFILGVIVLIHEFGHYIFAKKAGIYVHEFSIGMGPKLWSKKRKNDETVYSIRAIPIGGFVQLAGEEIEDDEEIPKEMRLQSKTWMQRFLTVVAGVVFNFILAIILLFFIALFWGSPKGGVYLGEMNEELPAYEAGITEGSQILAINGEQIGSWDEALIKFELLEEGAATSFSIEYPTGIIKDLTLTPVLYMGEDEDEESFKFGFSQTENRDYGLVNAFTYSFVKFFALMQMMFIIIGSLFTGALSVNAISGPVGVYGIIGDNTSSIQDVLYMIALFSVNVGFINLLPLPALDGGRLLFLFVEKIKGSPVKKEFENTVHTVGMVLLLLLTVYIAINDIFKLL